MNIEELLTTCPNSSQNESEGDKDEDPQIINLKTTKKNKSTRHNQSPITDLNCLRREPMSIITKHTQEFDNTCIHVVTLCWFVLIQNILQIVIYSLICMLESPSSFTTPPPPIIGRV